MSARIPFYGNLPDDLHCFQASLRMILKHFEPEVDFSWDQIDEITAMRKGFYTWPSRAFLWLRRRGYEIKSIDAMDFQRLVQEGRSYFAEYYGNEVATEQIAKCDFDLEMELLRQYLAEVEVPEQRIPTLQDIRRMHRDGFVTAVNINARKLNKLNGYVGHFVVLLTADLKRVSMHDPGLPHAPNRAVKIADFEGAWGYPDKKAKGVVGIRKTS